MPHMYRNRENLVSSVGTKVTEGKKREPQGDSNSGSNSHALSCGNKRKILKSLEFRNLEEGPHRMETETFEGGSAGV